MPAHSSNEYQRNYLREYRAKAKGFASYADYKKANKPSYRDIEIAFLNSEIKRLKYELEVALSGK